MSGLATLSGAPALGRRSDSNSSSSLTGGLLPLGGKSKPVNTTSDLDELLNIIDDEAPRNRSSKSSKADKGESKTSSKTKSSKESKSKDSKGKSKSKKSSNKTKSGESVKSLSDEEIVVSSDELEDVVLNAQSRSSSRPSNASNAAGVSDSAAVDTPFSDSSQTLLKPTGFSFQKGKTEASGSWKSKDVLVPESPEHKHSVSFVSTILALHDLVGPCSLGENYCICRY